MSRSIRHRILRELDRLGEVPDSVDLCVPVGEDQHNIIHVLHGLSRLGQVTFTLRKTGRRQHLRKISITAQGRAALQAMELEETRGA